MSHERDLNRRDFAKLTVAALAGVCAGSQAEPAVAKSQPVPRNPILSDPHICRGINMCRARGADRRNECSGMGTCATAAYHICKGHNECRGQGGCDMRPGENQCRGWGMCDVPLKPVIWQRARARFEQLMKENHWRCGPAPLPRYAPPNIAVTSG
jgi:hypothetical protein